MAWARSQDLANHRLGPTWLVHDCVNTTVCVELKKPGWENFFIGSKIEHVLMKIHILYDNTLTDSL